MIIQTVIFKSALNEDEIRGVMEERMPQFQALPGLVQKYYVANRETEEWAGFYIWDSPESVKEYRDSDLAKSIPQAYKVSGRPNVQVYEVITRRCGSSRRGRAPSIEGTWPCVRTR